jgi:hypothetical protein
MRLQLRHRRLHRQPRLSPPVITKVDFQVHPGHRTKFSGWVSFTDPDGDVTLMTLEVISAETIAVCRAIPTSPFRERTMADTAKLRQRPEITMRVTLFDAAGNSSN